MPHNINRRFRRAVAAALVLLASGPLAAQRPDGPEGGADRTLVEHVLNRTTYGPRPGDVDSVQAMGLAVYLELQLHPERIGDAALDARLATFETLGLRTRDLVERYFQPAEEVRRRTQAAARNQSGPGQTSPPAAAPADRSVLARQRAVMTELAQAKILRAVMSERQLQEVLADFWLNHFNVFAGKGQVRQYLTEYERDVIRPHVLGNFRDLLGAVAHSPAMLFYLDNWQSASPTPTGPVSQEMERRLERRQMQMQRPVPRPARGLNENYARELMELHTLGVDGGFTQTDVVELARILTGWTIDQPRAGGAFVFRPAMHDTGTKTFLGATFGPAGQVEGEHALDLLARHPATARHIAFKLAQRFVADEPPEPLVARAAAIFASTQGDLREVVRSILTSPEFLDPGMFRAKVKTPIEFVVSAVRATGATLATAQPLVVALQNLAMPLYGCQPPTGYSMSADAWVSSGALLNRMTFATSLVAGGRVLPIGLGREGAPGQERPAIGGRGPARGAAARSPVRIDVGALAPDVTEASRTSLVERLFAAGISETTAQTLARAATPQQLLALILGSPEFQRR